MALLALAFGVFLSPAPWNSGIARASGAGAVAQIPAPTGVAPERMPDFDLRDTRGHEVTSAQYRGKVLLLDFWATCCAPCRREMPGYERLYRRYKDRGLAVVGIAADSDVQAVSRFGRKLGITYSLLVNGMDVQRYGVKGLPTTILVDRGGFVREKLVGFEYSSVIERDLQKILSDPVEVRAGSAEGTCRSTKGRTAKGSPCSPCGLSKL